jgi:hypothetical protein
MTNNSDNEVKEQSSMPDKIWAGKSEHPIYLTLKTWVERETNHGVKYLKASHVAENYVPKDKVDEFRRSMQLIIRKLSPGHEIMGEYIESIEAVLNTTSKEGE